ncbi:hypothetical protein [Tateyamaria omphalii]|nr:hypothetical protein [Tateyamaria omphalii]
MPSHSYLYQSGRHFHFRRRIPGLSTSIGPVRIALGTTDPKTAHTWLRTLITEFDAVLDDFIFIIDPLPEEVIAHYMRARLLDTINRVRRSQRMEAYAGRRKASHATTPVQRVVLEALLIDGLNTAFPPVRLDASWSVEDVEAAVSLHAHEASALKSSEMRRKLFAEFEAVTGAKPGSREHECQIIEAYLHARLAALGAHEDAAKLRVNAFSEQARKLVEGSAIAPWTTTEPVAPAGPPAPAEFSATQTIAVPSIERSSSSTEQAASPPSRAAFTEGVGEVSGTLTNDALCLQQEQAKAVASSHEPVSDGADIASVFWRMALTEGFSPETIAQRATSVRLFCLISGVQRVDEIRQHHLSGFRDVLTRFPTNFMKSASDGQKSIEEIMQQARLLPKDRQGLGVTTRQRHVKSIELLLERAASEGHPQDGDLNVKKIKPKAKGKGSRHNQRSVFTLPELTTVFGHSLWQGARSKGDRHKPGTVIVKDSRYWIPLILAYTGARRAEIAGLEATDVQEIERHACIVIQANKYRGLKGEEQGETDPRYKKTRVVPIHPHLIELGLLDHASDMQRRGHGLLFPDVVPKPQKGSARADVPDPALMVKKFGASIDHMWSTSLKRRLDGNPRKLCMHSMRHYVNDFFLFNSDVLGATRFDLVGHVKSETEDVNTAVYRGEAPMRLKVAAIEQLPRLF